MASTKTAAGAPCSRTTRTTGPRISTKSWHYASGKGKGGKFKEICATFRAPWEPGITRGVLTKDQWTCKMEICLYGDRRIDPTIKWMSVGPIPENYGSMDHIVPLSVPGTPGHVWSNVRATHVSCNREGAGLVWLTHQVGRLVR